MPHLILIGMAKEEVQNPQESIEDPWLAAFLSHYIQTHDILVFQEITNLSRFKNQIIDNQMNCLSYNKDISKYQFKHQFIAICIRPGLYFAPFEEDDDYIIENVATSFALRPALHATITNGHQILAHVIGLHLKAGGSKKNYTTRKKQVQEIINYLLKFPSNQPTIIAGDFNSTTESETQEHEDLFWSSGLSLKPIPFSGVTYNNSYYRNKLDYIWINNKLQVTNEPFIGGACNHSSGTSYNNLDFYNKNISDHCPLSVQLTLQQNK